MSADHTDTFEKAAKAIIEGNDETAAEVIAQAREEGTDLMELLMKGFGKGSGEIMARFDSGEITVAELLYASDTMKEATNEIFRCLGIGEAPGPVSPDKPRVLLATVAGDIHDLGKGLVGAFLRNSGFEVIDLGCEVSVEAIALAAREFDVDIIGTSALLTSSLKEQKKLEKYLRETGERDRYITMVGGAPVTQRWAQKIGADGYSDTAKDAVEKALELLRKKNDEPR